MCVLPHCLVKLTFGQSCSCTPASTSHSARSTLIFSRPTSLHRWWDVVVLVAVVAVSALALICTHVCINAVVWLLEDCLQCVPLICTAVYYSTAAAHLMLYCSMSSDTVTVGHLIFFMGRSSSTVNRSWCNALYSRGAHLHTHMCNTQWG